MITAADLVRLPYQDDLTLAGIAYATRSLAHTFDRMGGTDFERLRRIVAGKAVELAFRRMLQDQAIPHDVRGVTPFTEPDRYDIALGGWRCDLKAYLIFQKRLIRRLRRYPEQYLQAMALVPSDQATGHPGGERDLYIFVFINGLVTSDHAGLQKAISAGQVTWLVHPLPEWLQRPAQWKPLGRLAFKSEDARLTSICVGGQLGDHNFVEETISLSAGLVSHTSHEFYSIAYLQTPILPQGRVGLSVPSLDEVYLVHPGMWGNIWVYGLEIILAGWMPRVEFLRQAKNLAPGSRVLQYPHTRTQNLALPVRELYPIGDLIDRVREWSSQSRR
ncbi:MAG: hypothetical protein JW726_06825 [Anaerolineales bacterium]|nr:hypothetical protein [Anaerolineales bacterium]